MRLFVYVTVQRSIAIVIHGLRLTNGDSLPPLSHYNLLEIHFLAKFPNNIFGYTVSGIPLYTHCSYHELYVMFVNVLLNVMMHKLFL